MQFEAPDKEIKVPEPEEFRAIFRRRGSDLVFGATVSGKLQVSRYNHRYKAYRHYLHEVSSLIDSLNDTKQYLDREGYKAHSNGPVDPPAPPSVG